MASNGQLVVQMDTSGIEGAIASLEQNIITLQDTVTSCFSSLSQSITNFAAKYTGGFKEVAQSTSDSSTSLWDMIKTGKDVIEVLQLVGGAAKYVKPLTTFLQLAGESGGGLTGLLTALGALEGPLGAFGTAFSVAGGGLAGLKAGVGALLAPLGSLASTIAGFIGPVGIAIAVIGALVAGFMYLWNTSDEFRNFWIGVWESIVSFVSPILDAICLFFTETIPNAIGGFIEFFSNFGENVKEIANSIWSGIVTFFTETIPAWIATVIEFFSQIPYYLGYMVGLVIGFFLKFGQVLLDFILVDVPNFIMGIIEWFASLPGKIWEFLLNIISKIGEWGGRLYEDAKKWVEETITSIVNFFTSLPEKIRTKLSEVINKVKEWGSNLFTEGAAAAKNLFDSVVEGITNLPNKMIELGKNLIEGLWDGIKNAKEWLFGKIDEFCQGILDGITGFFDIFSPSHVMRDEIGKYLPAGIAVGFEMAVPNATKEMQDAADDMTNGLQDRLYANMDGMMGVALQNNASLSKSTSLLNAFPKTMKVINEGKQAIVVKLGDTTELAHALVEPMSEELAYLG